jgi:hypothetical protein
MILAVVAGERRRCLTARPFGALAVSAAGVAVFAAGKTGVIGVGGAGGGAPDGGAWEVADPDRRR